MFWRDRRAFLKAGIGVAAASLPCSALAAAGWRTYDITTKVGLASAKGASRVWLPLPMTAETAWHRHIGNSWSGNPTRLQLVGDGKYGVPMLYAEWDQDKVIPQLVVTSRVATRERSVDPAKPRRGAELLSAADRQLFTAPTDYIPTDGIVRESARGIVKGARNDVEKARAIYEWVVENTFRDPKVRGCGWGDIKTMLETGNLGGKCGDLNALFVGLARAVGVPARHVYGVCVAPSVYGYRSLGVGTSSVTREQHCRAEFFAEGRGWVPVDPADVRKVVLEEPPGRLSLNDPKVELARRRLFGSWEMNWIAYNVGHDIALPHSTGPKLPYFMYPNGETGGKRRDQLNPDAFKYSMTARELAA